MARRRRRTTRRRRTGGITRKRGTYAGMYKVMPRKRPRAQTVFGPVPGRVPILKRTGGFQLISKAQKLGEATKMNMRRNMALLKGAKY